MSITAPASLSCSNASLTSLLKAGGASTEAIGVVKQDLADIRNGATAAGKTLSSAELQTALSGQIDADVKAGKLSATDATAVRQALGLPEDSAGSAASGTAKGAAKDAVKGGGGPHGDHDGDGGGGKAGGAGTTTKTEVSRVETVSKGLKTTVITYNDGTSETQTSFTAQTDSKPQSDAARAYQSDAGSYVASLQPGSLIQVSA